MFKILLAICMLPLLSMAHNTGANDHEHDLRTGAVISFEDFSELDPVHAPSRCSGRSDMFCYGKAVGTVCIRSPQPPYGSSGICQTRGPKRSDGRLSCLCR